MAEGSSWPPPLDGLPPWPADSAGGFWGDAGAGLGLPPERCLAPAAGHPLAGQAGPDPLDPLDPLDPPEPLEPPGWLMGGADPPARLWLLTGAEDPGAGAAAARGRGPAPGERPAPRDQPEADPATSAGPPDPFGAPLPDRGGRSSGGATRPPPSASAAFLARAEPAPLTPLTTRREPGPTSPSPSAGGGASGRSRDA